MCRGVFGDNLPHIFKLGFLVITYHKFHNNIPNPRNDIGSLLLLEINVFYTNCTQIQKSVSHYITFSDKFLSTMTADKGKVPVFPKQKYRDFALKPFNCYFLRAAALPQLKRLIYSVPSALSRYREFYIFPCFLSTAAAQGILPSHIVQLIFL